MMKSMITILGPTACGKTTFAAHLAHDIGGEIISADSRQVYRAMDIGTGKDLDDYIVAGDKIPYHLIDIVDAGEKYNVFRYQHDFLEVYNDICSRNVVPILCGGTGLYIESVLRSYHLSPVPQNPVLRESLAGKTLEELTEILRGYKALHNTTDTDTVQRAIRAIEIEDYCAKIPLEDRCFPEVDTLVVGLDIERGLRREKITKRLKQRLDEGMVEEVKRLLDKGVSPDDLIYYGLEYKYLTLYVIGKMSYEEMVRLLEIAIHQFAKRQMTWFRGMERRGIKINWIDAALPVDERLEMVRCLWNDYNLGKYGDK
ncbi:MAG: tRNA (adenosine(37)-N6)-dimethylallyltransferase MiaA [Bacteroides sp.]|nr:tRNA (adenosine(37)-N6)-dimethylallyltransferase MiaA [Roseburia sp.]MCM1347302.1 tRNA (adenosine(37)-N6)-dimethylallyltransferase MiaA [Bacteroides sp.]MCM1419779.1 tRNA (adenosine(37)-N6)-dimethylallyltransferase MiaA [Bacteroides sp.]